MSGDRRAGKSWAVLQVALLNALDGKRVLFVCRDLQMAQHFRSVLEGEFSWLPWVAPWVIRRYRSASDMRIAFHSGGEVRFIGARSSGRGFRADVLVLDEIDDENVLAAAVPCVGAGGRVYRTALSGGG